MLKYVISIIVNLIKTNIAAKFGLSISCLTKLQNNFNTALFVVDLENIFTNYNYFINYLRYVFLCY